MGPILLASASPRRRDLLAAAGFAVTVRPSGVDEAWPPGLGVADAVVALAQRKRAALGPQPGLVLAADTVVWDGAPLGKPRDSAAAAATLRRLAGRPHTVVTGFVLARGEAVHAQAVQTEVAFRPLTEAEIGAYVARGEGHDKAGGYAIQGAGGALVDWVRGSYTNVVGLPLAEVVAAATRLSAATA